MDDRKLEQAINAIGLIGMEINQTNAHLKNIEGHLWWLALGVIISLILLILSFFAMAG